MITERPQSLTTEIRAALKPGDFPKTRSLLFVVSSLSVTHQSSKVTAWILLKRLIKLLPLPTGGEYYFQPLSLHNGIFDFLIFPLAEQTLI